MRRIIVRTTLPIAAAALIALAVGTSPAAASAELVHAVGTFDSDGPAFAYAPTTVPSAVLVPAGATAEVRVVATAAGSTVATLQLRGFPANTAYGVHAHTGYCGLNPGSSAGHYKDAATGPVDDQNELWLGFTTNDAGNGRAQTVVDWHFRPAGAHSITFHYGAANARVACLPVPF